jgi:hypothetical protein
MTSSIISPERTALRISEKKSPASKSRNRRGKRAFFMDTISGAMLPSASEQSKRGYHPPDFSAEKQERSE